MLAHNIYNPVLSYIVEPELGQQIDNGPHCKSNYCEKKYGWHKIACYLVSYKPGGAWRKA